MLGVVKDSIQILKLVGAALLSLSFGGKRLRDSVQDDRRAFFGWPWGGCPMMTEIAMPIAKADNRVDTIG